MRNTYLIVFVLMMTSCSSALKIRVDVLNREALRKFPEFNKLEAEQIYVKLKTAYDKSFFDEYRKDLKKLTRAEITKLVNDAVIAPADAPAITTKINTTIDQTLEKVKTDVDGALKSYETPSLVKGLPEYAAIKGKIEASVVPFLELKHNLEVEIGHPINGFDLFFEQKKRELSLSDDELLDDLLTSSVVHSPKRFWKLMKVKSDFSLSYKKTNKKSPYSRTLVRTFMGNSDIAITMENKGHFTVKGVRLDAAKVVEATFKGLTQSIHFLAMTSGVPVKKDDSEVPLLPELEQLSKARAETRENIQLFNESILQVANTVLLQQVDLLGTDATKKTTALKVTKDAFDSHRVQFTSTKK